MFKNILVMWRSAAFSVSENIAAISALIRSGRSSAQSSRSHRALMKLCFLRERKVSLFLHFSPHIFHSSRKSHSRGRCRQLLSWCSGSISCGVPPRRRSGRIRFDFWAAINTTAPACGNCPRASVSVSGSSRCCRASIGSSLSILIQPRSSRPTSASEIGASQRTATIFQRFWCGVDRSNISCL